MEPDGTISHYDFGLIEFHFFFPPKFLQSDDLINIAHNMSLMFFWYVQNFVEIWYPRIKLKETFWVSVWLGCSWSKCQLQRCWCPSEKNKVVLPALQLDALVVNYGISITIVLEIQWFTTKSVNCMQDLTEHDDIKAWRGFPRYWSVVWGIYQSPVDSLHKGPVMWGAGVFYYVFFCHHWMWQSLYKHVV